MKAYGGVDVWIHTFLTSAIAGGEWLASRPCRFTPGEITPVPLDRRLGEAPEPDRTTWGRENCWHYRDSNSDPSVFQPLAHPAPQYISVTHFNCSIRNLRTADVQIVTYARLKLLVSVFTCCPIFVYRKETDLWFWWNARFVSYQVV
jgi:hypothetical protein